MEKPIQHKPLRDLMQSAGGESGQEIGVFCSTFGPGNAQFVYKHSFLLEKFTSLAGLRHFAPLAHFAPAGVAATRCSRESRRLGTRDRLAGGRA
jgi:hypothetical protein